MHSTYEAEVIKQRQPKANVHFVPWAFTTRTEPAEFAGRKGIVFVGGFGHMPNVDAVDWFVEEVWPAVAEKTAHPFRIVGSKMPARFERLGVGGVEPIGYVEHLDKLLDETLLTVAPLRYGAGLKGKVLSSLARGVPCLMTPVAAEGMELPEELRTLVAADAPAFSERIVELTTDAEQWLRLSELSVKFVRDRFSSEEIDRLIGETLANAGRAKQSATGSAAAQSPAAKKI